MLPKQKPKIYWSGNLFLTWTYFPISKHSIIIVSYTNKVIFVGIDIRPNKPVLFNWDDNLMSTHNLTLHVRIPDVRLMIYDLIHQPKISLIWVWHNIIISLTSDLQQANIILYKVKILGCRPQCEDVVILCTMNSSL